MSCQHDFRGPNRSCLECKMEWKDFLPTLNDRYHVVIADCAGEFESVEVMGFEAALVVTRRFSECYPQKTVVVSNLEQCDYNTHGLSDDEQDAIDEAIDVGRAQARLKT